MDIFLVERNNSNSFRATVTIKAQSRTLFLVLGDIVDVFCEANARDV